MKHKRSTFRSTKNDAEINLSYLARKNIRQTNERNNRMYNPDRPRDAAELETMRRAAIKNPHGRAALMLANNMRIPIAPKKGVTVTDVPAPEAPAKPKRAKKATA